MDIVGEPMILLFTVAAVIISIIKARKAKS